MHVFVLHSRLRRVHTQATRQLTASSTRSTRGWGSCGTEANHSWGATQGVRTGRSASGSQHVPAATVRLAVRRSVAACLALSITGARGQVAECWGGCSAVRSVALAALCLGIALGFFVTTLLAVGIAQAPGQHTGSAPKPQPAPGRRQRTGFAGTDHLHTTIFTCTVHRRRVLLD